MQIQSSQLDVSVQQARQHYRERHVVAVHPDKVEGLPSLAQVPEKRGSDTSDPALHLAPPSLFMTVQPATEADKTQGTDSQSTTEPALALQRRLVEIMSGKRLDWFDLLDPYRASQEKSDGPSATTASSRLLLIKEQEVDYQAYEFCLSLDLQMAQGPTYRLDAQLAWQQLNLSSTSFLVSEAQLTDPMVLSFDWRVVSFAGDTSLDLNADGRADRLPTPQGNAGYLVRDQGGNQRMDTAGELLGVTSGDAWADLHGMDDNGDGILDSRDPDYRQLYWWQPKAGSTLYSLRSLQIDAILLQGADTVAELAPDAQPLARLRRSGIFVYQNEQNRPTLGLMQQFDFYT